MQSLPQDRPLGRHPPEGSPPAVHPLAVLIADAAAGRFPAVDGAGGAPGNAASLRAAMTAGFSPIGSMQLFRRARS